jgi:hypothetical protein
VHALVGVFSGHGRPQLNMQYGMRVLVDPTATRLLGNEEKLLRTMSSLNEGSNCSFSCSVSYFIFSAVHFRFSCLIQLIVERFDTFWQEHGHS